MIHWLLQVFKIAYCQLFKLGKEEEYQSTCEAFVQSIKEHCPELQKSQDSSSLTLPEHICYTRVLLTSRFRFYS